MTEKWGTRRGFIKLHVGVDARTEKIYAVVITDDKCGDSPQFEELAEQAFANAEKSSNVNTPADPRIAADGAHDTRKIRRYCSEKGIAPQIPVRINFSGNSGGCVVFGLKIRTNFPKNYYIRPEKLTSSAFSEHTFSDQTCTL